MAHNLGRAIGRLAEHDLRRATAATLRQRVFTVPAGWCAVAEVDTCGYPPAGRGPRQISAALRLAQVIPLRC